MAFSNAEKIKILKFLGWPANTINSTSLSYSKIISDRLLNVMTEAEDEVRTLLDRLEAIETSLIDAVDSSGVKKIDEIEFFGAQDGTKLSALRSEKKRVIYELATLLDMAFGPRYSGGVPSMGNVCV